MPALAPSIMRLRVLGPVGVDPPVNGARRLAVLVYLALARPRGPHARDTLIGLLWPETDQSGARHSLRNALHALRQALGPDVIVTTGDSLVGIDPLRVDCDALALEADVAAGRYEEAIARYHGELLQGFYVPEAPEFGHWIDGERRRLRELVQKAAWSHAEALRGGGESGRAVEWARRASALAPDDEISLRRLQQFLEDGGDRAAAIRAYDEFAERLRREFETEPSAETQALVQSLREPPSADQVSAAAPPPREPRVAIAREPTPAPPPSVAKRPGRRRLPWAAGGLVVLLAVAATALETGRATPDAAPTLVVLPMVNGTGDAALDYLGSGLADDIARRLNGIGNLVVHSGARSDWPDSVRGDLKRIAREFGANTIVESNLARAHDSLELRVSVIDVKSSNRRPIIARAFTQRDLDDVERDAAASIVGALFRAPIVEMPRAPVRKIDPESYRLTLEGFHQLLVLVAATTARDTFVKAVQLDAENARAFAGLSSAWATLFASANVPFDEGAERIEAAATRALALDSLQGSAWANLAFVRAMRARDLSVGLRLIAKAERVDPSNPEVFLVASSLYRHAWRWSEARDALRISRKLEPLNSYYLEREGSIALCADDARAALQLFEQELAINPSDKNARAGRDRALARLGQPPAGYWEARHADGARQRDALRRATDRFVSPFRLMAADFAAGDTTNGFAALERLANEGEGTPYNLYKLPCTPGLDEVRGTAHLKAIMARVGPLPSGR